jgi:hypothetical protein
MVCRKLGSPREKTRSLEIRLAISPRFSSASILEYYSVKANERETDIQPVEQ